MAWATAALCEPRLSLTHYPIRLTRLGTSSPGEAGLVLLHHDQRRGLVLLAEVADGRPDCAGAVAVHMQHGGSDLPAALGRQRDED